MGVSILLMKKLTVDYHLADIAFLCQLLQPLNVRFRHADIGFFAEQKGDIYVHAFTDQLFDGRNARFGSRHFNHDVFAPYFLPEAPRFFQCSLRVVSQKRRDLQADESIAPACLLVNRLQNISGVLNIANGDFS